MSILGPDVSAAQGLRLDWRGIAAAGCRFAIPKASHGATYMDPTWIRNHAEATAAGLAVGAYHWLSPQSDPKAQAANLLRCIWGRPLALPVMIDFEDPGFGAWEPAKAIAYCETFAREIIGAGHRAMTYTGKWFAPWAKGGDSAFLAALPLAHAEYPSIRRTGHTREEYEAFVAALPSGPHIAHPWERRGIKAAIWQFDGNGGLVLPDGMDAYFNEFLGDEAAFAAFCGRTIEDLTPTDPVPPPPVDPVAHVTGPATLAQQAAEDAFRNSDASDPVALRRLAETQPPPPPLQLVALADPPDTEPQTPSARKSSQRFAAVRAPILGVDDLPPTPRPTGDES